MHAAKVEGALHAPTAAGIGVTSRALLRIVLAALIIAAVTVAAAGLSGCKPTDELTEHIQDWNLGVLDASAEPTYQETPGASVDPTRISKLKESSDSKVDYKRVTPQYDPNYQEPEQTEEQKHNKDTDNDENASKGTEQGQGSQSGTQSTGEQADDATPEESDDGEEQDDSGDGEETGGETNGGGQGGEGKIVDAGSYEELPEDVGTVAACGQYALIVQMLAGKGALVAADEDWLESIQESKAFADEGLSEVESAWSGSGKKSGSVRMKALLATGVDCVITDGQQPKFTEAELKKLTSSGVDVVTVPRLGSTDTPDEDITECVQVIGELLRSCKTCEYKPAKMASTYTKLHDEAIKAVRSANGGYSYKYIADTTMDWIYQGTAVKGQETTELSSNRVNTAFIDTWSTETHASATGKRHHVWASAYLDGEMVDTSDGIGLSVAALSSNFALMDYYLQNAGVVNSSYDNSKPGEAVGEATRYAIVAGDAGNITTQPLKDRNTPSALWYYEATNTPWVTVGDDAFPVLLVRSTKIMKSVVTSAAKVNGLYNVGQKYRVQVVPEGIAGSWADGTTESFLLAVWSWGIFQQNYDLSDCETYVESYYSTFYRISADDAVEAVGSFNEHKSAKCPTQ